MGWLKMDAGSRLLRLSERRGVRTLERHAGVVAFAGHRPAQRMVRNRLHIEQAGNGHEW